LVRDANLLAAEFRRDDIQFSPNLYPQRSDFGDKFTTLTFAVRVDNLTEGYFYIWDADKFSNRVDLIKELAHQYYETRILPDFSDKSKDPFWDPPEAVHIGTSYLQLKNLGYTVPNESDRKIFSTLQENAEAGKIKCGYYPCDQAGTGEPAEDLEVDEPEGLLGKQVFFRLEVDGCIDLPSELCNDVYVTYCFKHEPGVVYRVPPCPGRT